MALVVRFPIPKIWPDFRADYCSGPNAVIPAMVAVFLYGIYGGFVILGVLGGIGGALTTFLKLKLLKPRRTVCIGSVVITFVCLFVLAVLDYIIGPW